MAGSCDAGVVAPMAARRALARALYRARIAVPGPHHFARMTGACFFSDRLRKNRSLRALK
jgi:hypothetical protein